MWTFFCGKWMSRSRMRAFIPHGWRTIKPWRGPNGRESFPLTLGRGLPVVVQTKPVQILPQHFGVFRAGSLGIQILHPQDHFSVPGADRQPGDQGRKHIAQVHPPRRGGRKPTHRRCHSSITAHQAAMARMPMVSRTARNTRHPIPFSFFSFLAFFFVRASSR